MAHEKMDLIVLKVFSAQLGEARYRSYLVNWNDQEVVVEDSLVHTDFQVGDRIPVLVINHPYPNGAKHHGLLSFMVGA